MWDGWTDGQTNGQTKVPLCSTGLRPLRAAAQKERQRRRGGGARVGTRQTVSQVEFNYTSIHKGQLIPKSSEKIYMNFVEFKPKFSNVFSIFLNL